MLRVTLSYYLNLIDSHKYIFYLLLLILPNEIEKNRIRLYLKQCIIGFLVS
jgi:hypothetical protein